MGILGKIAATIGVVGAIAGVGVMPASAVDVHVGHHGVYIGHRHHHPYYNYGGGYYLQRGYYGGLTGPDPNGCPPGYSLQGGNCAPYRGY